MKYKLSLLRSNMNFSNIGPISLGDAEVQDQPLLQEQMAVSSPVTQQAHLVLPLQETRRSHASPRSSPQIPWQRSIWRSLCKKGDLTRMEMKPRHFSSSYYLDHVRHRHHYQARPLRFSLDFDNWEDDIRFIWEDHIDPDLNLAVHLVQPQPPAITSGGNFGTLIVHQNPHEPQVAASFRAVIISDPNTRVQESAHSVEPLLPPERALQLGGVDDLCALREQAGHDVCSLHIGFRLVPRDEPIQTHDGLGITVRVPSPMSIEEDEHNLAVRVQNQQAQRPLHDWHGGGDNHDQPERTHLLLEQTYMHSQKDVTSFMARSLSSAALRPDSTRGPSTSSSSSRTSTLGLDEMRRAIVYCLDGRTVNINAPWDDADQLLACLRANPGH